MMYIDLYRALGFRVKELWKLILYGNIANLASMIPRGALADMTESVIELVQLV